MKSSILIIAVVISLIVSISLILNIHEPGPAPAQQLEPQPTQQREEVQEVANQKLHTKEHLATNHELYNYGEAWDIMRAEYTDTMQYCNSLDDIIEENECVTATTTRWLEIEDALERIYP